MMLDARWFRRMHWGPWAGRPDFDDEYCARPVKWGYRAGVEGYRRRVFCASMADGFDNNGRSD
jgi:hypothetical protein